MEKIETPTGPESELDDLELTADQAEQVKGGAEPTNERRSPALPPGSLNHNETVLSHRST